MTVKMIINRAFGIFFPLNHTKVSFSLPNKNFVILHVQKHTCIHECILCIFMTLSIYLIEKEMNLFLGFLYTRKYVTYLLKFNVSTRAA